jgi:hypothetical protein
VHRWLPGGPRQRLRQSTCTLSLTNPPPLGSIAGHAPGTATEEGRCLGPGEGSVSQIPCDRRIERHNRLRDMLTQFLQLKS